MTDKGGRVNKGKQRQERGKVETIHLKKPIVFNNNEIKTAVIEIDHINHGLDKKTGKLNKAQRSSFTTADIEKFLTLLDGEYLHANDHKGRVSRFSIRIDCPIKGRFHKKEFVMIFDTDYDKPNEIHTITIFPGW